MYEIEYTAEARKNLRKIHRDISRVIIEKIIQLANRPYSINNNVKSLRGVDGYRLRVGDYRVIYSIHNTKMIIRIIRIGHRKEVYRWN